jgi:hypothetical protein
MLRSSCRFACNRFEFGAGHRIQAFLCAEDRRPLLRVAEKCVDKQHTPHVPGLMREIEKKKARPRETQGRPK